VSVTDVIWIFFLLSALQPLFRQRLVNLARTRKIQQIEKRAGIGWGRWMSAFRTIARRTIRSRHLPLVGFLLVGLMLSAAAFRTWEARETIVSGHRREITNLGIALAAQAGRSLQSVDLVLRETQRQTLTIDARDAASFELDIGSQEMHWFLARHAKNLPQADSIGVFGADGQLVNSSRQWPPPRVNVAATDGFQYLRSHDDRDLYISRLVRSPVSANGRCI